MAHLPCMDFRRVFQDFDVSTALLFVLYLELDAKQTDQQLAFTL
jgi:hypothetical protein